MLQHRSIKWSAYLLTISCMAGCSLAPEIPQDQRVGTGTSRELAWPTLLPARDIPRNSNDVLSRTNALQTETDALRARAEALRTRAGSMSKPILTQQDRASLGATNG